MRPEEELRNRAAGCLLGLAIGDALGAPFESQKGPVEPPEVFLPHGNLPAGSYTDDTQLSVITAQSILECRDFNAEELAKRFAAAIGEIRGIGTTTKLVLEKVAEGQKAHYAAEATHLQLGRRSAGNGAIMRMAPIAIAFWDDIPKVCKAAADAAAIIHYDPLAHNAAQAVAELTALLLSGASIREQALATVEALFLPKDSCVAAALRKGASASAEELRPETGFAIDTLTAAIWAFLEKDNFKECVQAAVSIGGDTDTTAAITGSLAGAMWGLDAIPKAWRDGVEDSRKIINLAGKLVEFSLSRGI